MKATGNEMSGLSSADSQIDQDNENVFSDFSDLCDMSNILSYGPETTAKMAASLPKVDFGTFSPLLGTKFFCFNPSSFVQVTEEIHSYLNDFTANVNYDFDSTTHVWKCSETSGYDTSAFNISLYEDSSKNKIFVKFHRLSGTPAVFSSSVERFSKLSYVMNELKAVDPSDLSESAITSENKKRKGFFKAMPLPLTVRQKTVTSSEFISYCEIFNIWAQSDVQESLGSILSSMPKMWKDLTLFYKGVENLAPAEAAASTAELILMFSSINKIYKNLCSIAVHSFYALHNSEARQPLNLTAAVMEVVAAPVYVAPEPVQVMTVEPEVVMQQDYLGNYTHNYDFLDFDEGEQMDGTAGYGDDFHYGADASRNNEGNRHTVTMDISKGNYRSMAVFEGRQQEEYVSAATMTNAETVQSAASMDVSIGKQTYGSSNNNNQLYEINMNTKSCVAVTATPAKTLFSKLVSAASSTNTSGSSTPEANAFADMFAQRSKEELSKVLSLSLACICSQLPGVGQDQTVPLVSSFDVAAYLSRVLNNNGDFIHVLQDMAKKRLVSEVGHTYDQHNSRQILTLALQLQKAV